MRFTDRFRKIHSIILSGGFVLWKRGATCFFASKQIKVTYVHNDTYTFDIGIYGGERLNRIKEKLYKKRFQDMTSNNTNHPNDFLARIYAQAILEAF